MSRITDVELMITNKKFSYNYPVIQVQRSKYNSKLGKLENNDQRLLTQTNHTKIINWHNRNRNELVGSLRKDT